MSKKEKNAVAVAVLWTLADSKRDIGWLGHAYSEVCALGFHTMMEVDTLIKVNGFLFR